MSYLKATSHKASIADYRNESINEKQSRNNSLKYTLK